MNEYDESVTGPAQSNCFKLPRGVTNQGVVAICYSSGYENREFHKHPLKSSNISRTNRSMYCIRERDFGELIAEVTEKDGKDSYNIYLLSQTVYLMHV